MCCSIGRIAANARRCSTLVACTFSASGREDCDVRMLGKGRPFVLEIVDAKIAHHTAEAFAEMQREINSNTDLMRVNDLQAVPKYASELARRC
jgi:tRNA pseudouridine synthase 10